MVRCRSKRLSEFLVKLHVVTSPHGNHKKTKKEGENEELVRPSLDVHALCDEIIRRMRLLGGLAVDQSTGGMRVVAVREYDDGGEARDVVLRLAQASPLVLTALRAACASVAMTVAATVTSKRRREENADGVVPVAVRVVEMKELGAAAV